MNVLKTPKTPTGISLQAVAGCGVVCDNVPYFEAGDFVRDGDGTVWQVWQVHRAELMCERYEKLPEGVISLTNSVFTPDAVNHTQCFIDGWCGGFERRDYKNYMSGTRGGGLRSPSITAAFNLGEMERGYLRGIRRREFFDYCQKGGLSND